MHPAGSRQRIFGHVPQLRGLLYTGRVVHCASRTLTASSYPAWIASSIRSKSSGFKSGLRGASLATGITTEPICSNGFGGYGNTVSGSVQRGLEAWNSDGSGSRNLDLPEVCSGDCFSWTRVDRSRCHSAPATTGATACSTSRRVQADRGRCSSSPEDRSRRDIIPNLHRQPPPGSTGSFGWRDGP